VDESLAGKIAIEFLEYASSAPQFTWVLDSWTEKLRITEDLVDEHEDEHWLQFKPQGPSFMRNLVPGASATVLKHLEAIARPIQNRTVVLNSLIEAGHCRQMATWMCSNLRPSADNSKQLDWRFDLDVVRSLIYDAANLDSLEVMRKAKSEVGFVRAEHGVCWPKDAMSRLQQTSANNPMIKLYMLEKAAHWLHVDSPAELVELILPSFKAATQPSCASNSATQGQCGEEPKPATPDFNTSVNVHEHSISLRDKRSQRLSEMGEKSKQSLVPASLKHIAEDDEHQITAENLRKLGQEKLTMEERKKRRRALDTLGVPSFHAFLKGKGKELVKTDIEILQLNIGLYCNQACNHCHVESSPKRNEMMMPDVAQRCLELARSTPTVKTLDLTGGAPELNQSFRHLVIEGRKMGLEVIDRCNLTVLSEPGQEDLAQFLADNRVRVVASLPCYSEKNVDTQVKLGMDVCVCVCVCLHTHIMCMCICAKDCV
jgi:hypothetical protein